jgi:hypothetical protein
MNFSAFTDTVQLSMEAPNERMRGAASRAKRNPLPTVGGGDSWKGYPLRSSPREGVSVKAIEVGLLTRGSSHSPTPSQPFDGQWYVPLAFAPAHSGASVRDLHPLPASVTYIAVRINIGDDTIMLRSRCQAIFT